jgi:aryl-alcohol dehydrogenase-like predicted oxidoreductase
VLAQPWVSVVLSGAATTAQLASNLRAVTTAPPPPDFVIAESAATYWQTRSALPWT